MNSPSSFEEIGRAIVVGRREIKKCLEEADETSDPGLIGTFELVLKRMDEIIARFKFERTFQRGMTEFGPSRRQANRLDRPGRLRR
jgi:hypothetical protein